MVSLDGVIVRSLADTAWRAAFLVGYGVLVVFVLYLGFLKSRAIYRGDEDGVRKVNCPSCGARTPADGETCHYCESPIDG